MSLKPFTRPCARICTTCPAARLHVPVQYMDAWDDSSSSSSESDASNTDGEGGGTAEVGPVCWFSDVGLGVTDGQRKKRRVCEACHKSVPEDRLGWLCMGFPMRIPMPSLTAAV